MSHEPEPQNSFYIPCRRHLFKFSFMSLATETNAATASDCPSVRPAGSHLMEFPI